jgi:hypothetical protein
MDNNECGLLAYAFSRRFRRAAACGCSKQARGMAVGACGRIVTREGHVGLACRAGPWLADCCSIVADFRFFPGYEDGPGEPSSGDGGAVTCSVWLDWRRR